MLPERDDACWAYYRDYLHIISIVPFLGTGGTAGQAETARPPLGSMIALGVGSANSAPLGTSGGFHGDPPGLCRGPSLCSPPQLRSNMQLAGLEGRKGVKGVVLVVKHQYLALPLGMLGPNPRPQGPRRHKRPILRLLAFSIVVLQAWQSRQSSWGEDHDLRRMLGFRQPSNPIHKAWLLSATLAASRGFFSYPLRQQAAEASYASKLLGLADTVGTGRCVAGVGDVHSLCPELVSSSGPRPHRQQSMGSRLPDPLKVRH